MEDVVLLCLSGVFEEASTEGLTTAARSYLPAQLSMELDGGQICVHVDLWCYLVVDHH